MSYSLVPVCKKIIVESYYVIIQTLPLTAHQIVTKTIIYDCYCKKLYVYRMAQNFDGGKL